MEKIEALSPRQLSNRLRSFLRQADILGLVKDELRCGWTNGGCNILAVAVYQWLIDAAWPKAIPELLQVEDAGDPEHVVVQLGGWIIDGRGVCRPETLKRFLRAHFWQRPTLREYDPWDCDDAGIPVNEEISELLALELSIAFDAHQVVDVLLKN